MTEGGSTPPSKRTRTERVVDTSASAQNTLSDHFVYRPQTNASTVGEELENARSLILLAKVSGSDVLMLSAPLRVSFCDAR